MNELLESNKPDMQTIAHIDTELYACVVKNIRSDRVVLLENQKEHIIKRRGQNFFNKYSCYFQEIAEQPDYIFADKAHPHTAIACKTIETSGKSVNLVIRLAVETDADGLENSIITAIIENNKRFQQRLRNNKLLYKRECL